MKGVTVCMRRREVAQIITGNPAAAAEDGAAWIEALCKVRCVGSSWCGASTDVMGVALTVSTLCMSMYLLGCVWTRLSVSRACLRTVSPLSTTPPLLKRLVKRQA